MDKLLIKKFNDAVINLINEGNHIPSSLLYEMKANGFSNIEAFDLFEKIRILDFVQADDEKEEIIMSAMDIICGWCASHRYVWDPPYKKTR